MAYRAPHCGNCGNPVSPLVGCMSCYPLRVCAACIGLLIVIVGVSVWWAKYGSTASGIEFRARRGEWKEVEYYASDEELREFDESTKDSTIAPPPPPQPDNNDEQLSPEELEKRIEMQKKWAAADTEATAEKARLDVAERYAQSLRVKGRLFGLAIGIPGLIIFISFRVSMA